MNATDPQLHACLCEFSACCQLQYQHALCWHIVNLLYIILTDVDGAKWSHIDVWGHAVSHQMETQDCWITFCRFLLVLRLLPLHYVIYVAQFSLSVSLHCSQWKLYPGMWSRAFCWKRCHRIPVGCVMRTVIHEQLSWHNVCGVGKIKAFVLITSFEVATHLLPYPFQDLENKHCEQGARNFHQ